MSRTVDIPSRSVPLQIALILSTCLVCLLVHFYMENLALSAQPFGMQWTASGETDGQSHDSGENVFIPPESTELKILQNSIRAVFPESLAFALLPYRPLLPPPILG